MLAADVSLVASGLNKECTEEKLNFLEEKRIKPVEVVGMQKPEASEAESRKWTTKSFKVTVKTSRTRRLPYFDIFRPVSTSFNLLWPVLIPLDPFDPLTGFYLLSPVFTNFGPLSPISSPIHPFSHVFTVFYWY